MKINRGYHYKLDYLRHIMSLPNVPSILCITESKFSLSVSDDELHIDGYATRRSDRNRRGGGVVLYTANQLLIEKVQVDTINIEALVIKVIMPKVKTFLLICVYRPPSSKTDWQEKYNKFLHNCTTVALPIVTCGDFNTDLSKDNTFAISVFSDPNLHQLITEPARIISHTATLVDQFYCSDVNITYAHCVSSIYLADHLSTYCCLFGKKVCTKLSRKFILYFQVS